MKSYGAAHVMRERDRRKPIYLKTHAQLAAEVAADNRRKPEPSKPERKRRAHNRFVQTGGAE